MYNYKLINLITKNISLRYNSIHNFFSKLSIFFIFYFLFLIFFTTLSYSATPNELDYLKINITNEVTFKTKISDEHSISRFDLFSYFLPQSYDGSQYLNKFESDFSKNEFIFENHSNYLRFDFKTDLNLNNKIINNFILESTVTKPKINQKNKYPIPINQIEDKYKQYLEFDNLVNLNTNIQNQASSLAAGEDDVFIIATKIANWITKDITYDLTSVLENPDQTSTDVFDSKQGVCKEITNLFTSMMRSLGIPTRFVTGYAYTNSEELIEYVGSNWGGHVWSEVLIGDTWVPFDLTYNQYGFVDATHIITDKSQFIRNNGVSLDALSYGIEIVPNSLSLKNEFEIIDDKDEIFDQGFEISLDGPTKLSFGSYGYITATIVNEKPYYQNIFLNFAKATEIEYLNENLNENIYVFKPYEEKEIHFKYKIPDTLDKNYKYTFPFLVYNEFIEETLKIEVADSYQYFEEITIPTQKTKQKFYTDNNLYYSCNYSLLKTVDNLNIECIVQNPNNFEIENLKICISAECKTLDLTVNELTQLSFQTQNKETQLLSNYEDITEKINLNFQYPKLSLSHLANFQKLEISTNILNYVQNTKLQILLNDNIIFDDIISELETFNFKVEPNSQNLKFKLYHDDVIFDELEKTILVEKTPFLQIIKDWFNDNLFKK
jgi:hypothetical protein